MQQTQSAPSWIDGPFRYCKQSQCVCSCKYKQKEVLHYLFGAKLTKIGRFLDVSYWWQPSLTPSWISQNAQWCQLGIMQILILHIFHYHNQQTTAWGVFLQGYLKNLLLATRLEGLLQQNVPYVQLETLSIKRGTGFTLSMSMLWSSLKKSWGHVNF